MYIPSNDDKINNYLTICILSDTDLWPIKHSGKSKMTNPKFYPKEDKTRGLIYARKFRIWRSMLWYTLIYHIKQIHHCPILEQRSPETLGSIFFKKNMKAFTFLMLSFHLIITVVNSTNLKGMYWYIHTYKNLWKFRPIHYLQMQIAWPGMYM